MPADAKSAGDHGCLRIEIVPVFEGDAPYYRMVVCTVDRDATGQELVEIRDIMHFDTLMAAADYLASSVRER